MSDKAFLDTNVLVYFYSEDDEFKRNAAYSVLNNNDCVTSVQALNESCNVWLRKFSWSVSKILAHLDNIETVCDDVFPILRNTVNKALSLRERYGYSYYDCLMLASALDGSCQIIFSEDMSDGQVINDTLKIVNPFKQT